MDEKTSNNFDPSLPSPIADADRTVSSAEAQDGAASTKSREAHQADSEEKNLPSQQNKTKAPDFFDSSPKTKPTLVLSENADSEESSRPSQRQKADPAFDFFGSSASGLPKTSDNDRHETRQEDGRKDGQEDDQDGQGEIHTDRQLGGFNSNFNNLEMGRPESNTARSDSSEVLSSFENLLAKQDKKAVRKANVPAKNREKSKKISVSDYDYDVYDDDQDHGQDYDDDLEHLQAHVQGKDDDQSQAKRSKRPAALKRPKAKADSESADNSSGGRSKNRLASKSGKSGRLSDGDEIQRASPRGKITEKYEIGGLSILGISIPFGQAALAILVSGVLLSLSTLAAIYFNGNQNQPVASASGASARSAADHNAPPVMAHIPRVAGQWSIEVTDRDHTFEGKMTLQQRGSELAGIGNDSVTMYTLTGSLGEGNTIVLQKHFSGPNRKQTDPPATLKGKLVLYKVPLEAAGDWEFIRGARSQSGFNRSAPAIFRGKWRATMIQSERGPGSTSLFPTTAVTKSEGPHLSEMIPLIQAYGIWVVLAIGVVAVGSSFLLFGPNGLINIWSKQKYIPSQFRAQHAKIRGQLGRGLKKGSLPLGQRVEWKWFFPMPWVVKDLALPPELRKVNPHVLILGQGGKGKTRLVAGMLTHDIASNDRAIVCIDSDGTLVDLVTRWIAAHPNGREFAGRVILIDPAGEGETPVFNPLQMPERGDLQSAATSIVYGFKAIYSESPGSQTQWNAQTAEILRNSVLLLMANDRTLLDLPALLQDNDFRDIMLETVERRKKERVEFMTLLEQWSRYKKLARTDQWITWVEPILNRINPVLSNPRLRAIFTEPEGDLNLEDVIVGKKILLVRVPRGAFGQDANLLGALIVAAVKQAALTLNAVAPKKQQEVALYLDNFDNFIEKETVDNITSETKIFKIGLVCVTKSLQSLSEDFRNQFIINIGTLITFALSKKDGDMLGPQMFPIDGRKVKHQTMSNLFNRVNTSPQFELVSDEEKLNIDKIVRQEARTFFCYRMGEEAGLFNLKAHPFEDIPNARVKKKLLQKMQSISSRKSDNEESE